MQIALKVAPVRAARSLDRPSHRAVFAAAALSLLAGFMHLAYMDSHFSQWWVYGAFFLVTGAGQALFAPLLIRWPSPLLIWTAIAGNLAIIGMYVVSRTEGVPLGPHAHIPEIASTGDLTATAAELLLVGVLLSLLSRTVCRRAVNVLLVAGLALWAMRLTGVLA